MYLKMSFSEFCGIVYKIVKIVCIIVILVVGYKQQKRFKKEEQSFREELRNTNFIPKKTNSNKSNNGKTIK